MGPSNAGKSKSRKGSFRMSGDSIAGKLRQHAAGDDIHRDFDHHTQSPGGATVKPQYCDAESVVVPPELEHRLCQPIPVVLTTGTQLPSLRDLMLATLVHSQQRTCHQRRCAPEASRRSPNKSGPSDLLMDTEFLRPRPRPLRLTPAWPHGHG